MEIAAKDKDGKTSLVAERLSQSLSRPRPLRRAGRNARALCLAIAACRCVRVAETFPAFREIQQKRRRGNLSRMAVKRFRELRKVVGERRA